MLQAEIDCAVARVTGESRRMIARRGFSLDERPVTPAGDLRIGLDCPGCGRLASLRPGAPANFPSEAECAHCDAVYEADPRELFIVERLAPHACLV